MPPKSIWTSTPLCWKACLSVSLQRSGEPKRYRPREYIQTPSRQQQPHKYKYVRDRIGSDTCFPYTNNKGYFLIAGDPNINIQQIHVVNNEHFAPFLDLIMFPTRTSESGSCTLIENIFRKLSKETLCPIAGILYTSISDHYPYFLSLTRSKNQG